MSVENIISFLISTKLEKVCHCYVHDRIWATFARFPLFLPMEYSPAALCDPDQLPLGALTNGDFAFGRGSVDYRGETRMKMGVS